MAHDFNNLLTIIGINLELLEREVDEGETIRQLQEAARRAASLTSGLLAFSRRQVLDKKPISARALLEESWEMLTRLVGENITTDSS